MRRFLARVIVAPLLAMGALAPSPWIAPGAYAQTAAAPDAAFDSQKAAFDAMPESDRRAIQDALIWSGNYLGVVDGTFGKRTRDAIVAWQTSVKAPGNGVIDAAQLAQLNAFAQKARAALRFQAVVDDKSGVKIGAPMKLLDKRAAIPGGARLSSADGAIGLDLLSLAGADVSLAKVYAGLTADAPNRSVTLKINKPDFIVVSGEEQGRKFYQRMAKAPAGWADATAIRGFRFVYPAARSAELDRVGVAIANSFEPFGAAPATTAAGSNPTPAAPPTPPPAPVRSGLAATGLVVAPGQSLSAIGAQDCATPVIAGKPAKFVREDREHGISLISGDFETGASVAPPELAPLSPDLVVLSYSSEDPAGRVALSVASASPAPARDDGAQFLLAPLDARAAGSPVFDRQGRLAAMIAYSKAEPKSVGGVVPVGPRKAIGSDQIKAFLSLSGQATPASGAPSMGAGQIVAAQKANLVAIYCRS